MRGVEHFYEDRLRKLWQFTLEKRMLCGDVTFNLPVLERAYREAGGGLFIRNCSDRTRGNGLKVRVGFD